MGITKDMFYSLSWYDWNLQLLRFMEMRDRRHEEIGLMMAHIANFTHPKKDQSVWRRDEFMRLSSDNIVSERKVTMKEAKQLLGGTWKHGK